MFLVCKGVETMTGEEKLGDYAIIKEKIKCRGMIDVAALWGGGGDRRQLSALFRRVCVDSHRLVFETGSDTY